jgi:hypothetical protein
MEEATGCSPRGCEHNHIEEVARLGKCRCRHLGEGEARLAGIAPSLSSRNIVDAIALDLEREDGITDRLGAGKDSDLCSQRDAPRGFSRNHGSPYHPGCVESPRIVFICVVEADRMVCRRLAAGLPAEAPETRDTRSKSYD